MNNIKAIQDFRGQRITLSLITDVMEEVEEQIIERGN